MKIGGIIQRRDLAEIGIMAFPHSLDAVAEIFQALGAKGVNCPFIVHAVGEGSCDNIVACASPEDLPAVRDALRDVQGLVGAKEVICDQDVGIVSIFGPHFGEEPGIAGEMLAAFVSAHINVRAMSCSISTLSCLIDLQDMDEAVRVLQEAFELP